MGAKPRCRSFAVAVQIGGNRNVFAQTELNADKAGIVASLDIPGAVLGRKTAKSLRPSPSKSPRTGLSVAKPNCCVVAPPSELRRSPRCRFQKLPVGFAVAVVIGGNDFIVCAAGVTALKP